MCTPGERKCLPPVTFKKTAGTAIIQCGLAAKQLQGSVIVVAIRERGSSSGVKETG